MKYLPAAALTLALLSACNPNPAAPSVTGNLDGEWSDLANVDVALVGLTDELVSVYDNQFQAVDATLTDGYSLALPADAGEGRYRVVAFVDENDNGTLDADEVKGDTGDKYLIYRETASGNFEEGWSAQTGLSGETVQSAVFGDFDIARTDGGAD